MVVYDPIWRQAACFFFFDANDSILPSCFHDILRSSSEIRKLKDSFIMTLEVPVLDPQRSFYFKSCDVDVKVTAFLPVALRLS